jgi:hypothetical protein
MSEISAINKAAFEGNPDFLIELLSALPQPVSIDKLIDPEDSNRGPLHFAILGKQVEIVRRLLDQFYASPFLLDDVIFN